MSRRKHLTGSRSTHQQIKQQNQSKEFDNILDNVEIQPSKRNKYHSRNQYHSSKLQQSIQNNQVNPPIQSSQEKFWTNQTGKKLHLPSTEYNTGRQFYFISGQSNLGQTPSPYGKFSTTHKFRTRQGTEKGEQLVKKKLFSEKYQESPQTKLNQSRLNDMVFTFKKKVEDYEPQFSQTRSSVSKRLQQQKKQYLTQRTSELTDNFDKDRKYSSTNQNNAGQINRLNFTQQTDHSSKKFHLDNSRRKLQFQTVEIEKQNPLIKQIKMQIKQSRQQQLPIETDYKTSRKNQSDLLKKKILQSKSDLSKIYQLNSQNVQYQYRKVKFIDIFLGGSGGRGGLNQFR